LVRKTAILIAFLLIFFAYYRHGVQGFDSLESVLKTLLYCLLGFFSLGVIGGVMAGAFYNLFLERIDARNTDASLVIFVVEWLFSLLSLVFGLLFFLSLGA